MRRLLMLATFALLIVAGSVPLLQQSAAVTATHATAFTRQIVCNGMPLPC
jgi:hypothetical protein